MATYLLVPGFWLGGWAWADVVEPMRAAGHEVVALTPAGDAAATIESRVIDLVTESRGRSGLVLVGYSGAGGRGGGRAGSLASGAGCVRRRRSAAQGFSHLDFVGVQARGWSTGQLAANDGWYPMPGRARLESWGAGTEELDTAASDRIRAGSGPEPPGAVTDRRGEGRPIRRCPRR